MRPHPLVDAIADLFLRPGHAPAREEMDSAHRARIRFEWVSGQWVLLAPDNKFHGWMSWYRCTDAILVLLRAGRIAALVARANPDDLTRGPHLYIATAVVAPRAPPGTYRALFRLVCNANPDARVIVAQLHKRDGRQRALVRRLH